MPTRPVAAVMFDMDGLLLDTERLYLDAFVSARADHDLPPDEHVFLACVGLRGDLTPGIIEPSLGGQLSLSAFNETWDAHITTRLAQGVPRKSGALELMQHLAAVGIPMGVATSTGTRKAEGKLDATGLLPFLSHVIGGDQVARPKPDPEIYHLLASTLGVDPSDCIAFEDSNTGTRAAHASGARTVQIPDLTPVDDATRALGHLLADDLLHGARLTGLLSHAATA